MAIPTILVHENVKLKRLNEKLLYLLNKYRYAYLKSLELVSFYEELIKRKCKENQQEKELVEGKTRKRQLEDTWKEELMIRKELKIKTKRKETSTDLMSCGIDGVATVGGAVTVSPAFPHGDDCQGKGGKSVAEKFVGEKSAESKSAESKSAENPIDKDHAQHTLDNPGNESNKDSTSERNKSNYVNLGALDFSAYREDSEGYIKYCEKKKAPTSNEKTNVESSWSNQMKQTHQSEFRKRPLFNQSMYGVKHSVIKASQNRLLPFNNKSVYGDNKYPKFHGAKKEDMITNKSVYISSGNLGGSLISRNMGFPRKIAKNELHKSSLISASHKPITNLNKSVYIETKGGYNRSSNLSEGLGSTNRGTHINRDNIKKNENIMPSNKKVNLSNMSNITNMGINFQNSVYSKRMHSSSFLAGGGTSGNGSSISFNGALNKSVYIRSNTSMGNEKKRKTNEVREDYKICSMNDRVKVVEDGNCKLDSPQADREISNNANDCVLGERNMDDMEDVEKEQINMSTTTDLNYIYAPLTLENIENLMGNEIYCADYTVSSSSLRNNQLGEREKVDGIEAVSVENDNKYGKEKMKGCPLETENYSARDEELRKYNEDVVSDKKEILPKFVQEADNKSSVFLNKINPVMGRINACNLQEINNQLCEKNIQSMEENIDKKNCSLNDKVEIERIISSDKHIDSLDKYQTDVGSSVKGRTDGNGDDPYNEGYIKNGNENFPSYKEGNEQKEILNGVMWEKETDDSTLKKESGKYVKLTTEDDIKNSVIKRDNKSDIGGLSQKFDENKSKEVKKERNEIPVKFQNIILSINDEIKKKLQRGNENSDSFHIPKGNDRNANGTIFTSNLLPYQEKRGEQGGEAEMSVSNSRANLHIEMSTGVRYISLDIIDIDSAMNEGLYNYKDVEESYIKSETNIKDISIYDNILKRGVQNKNNLPCYSTNGCYSSDVEKAEEMCLFKSSQDVKNDIVKVIGISIFDCLNEGPFMPSISLINDEKLSLWFTKKIREKSMKKNALVESNCRNNNFFLNIKNKRVSCMGYFTQPVTIMLCSLKRQNEYKSLKKIITSVVLCTCDSTTLEKLLHTIPESNSKNFSLWVEALHKLDIHLGPKRKRNIIKKFLQITKEETADGNHDSSNGPYDEDSESEENEEDKDTTGRINKYDNFQLKTYAFMKGMNTYDGYLNDSYSSKGTEQLYNASTPVSSGDILCAEKKNGEDLQIYEDEEFCLFVCTIPNIHKRFRYLLLIENFNFIYEDLLKNIHNKLRSIELITHKHLQLKQLFCNILFLCNWLNEPKMYKWFHWDLVVRKIEKVHGYLENGKISRDRSIMLLLVEHTGEIFSDKELHELKKISEFHIKDLYDRSIDFINSFLELNSEMDTDTFVRNCCVGYAQVLESEEDAHADVNEMEGINSRTNAGSDCPASADTMGDNSRGENFLKDKFLEKVHEFVENKYERMLLIISRLVLLIKQYIALIIWLGDIRPFYPLFSYVDETRKVKYSQDLFVNFVSFFESYNKYISIVKKNSELGKNNERKKHLFLNDNTSDCFLGSDYYSSTLNDGNVKMDKNMQDANSVRYDNRISKGVNNNTLKKKCNYGLDMSNDNNDSSKMLNTEFKKRKSLTNTVYYACEVKRKSVEKERRRKSIKRTSFENTCKEELHLYD
ncbi:nuclear formin-like protein [Plasmodium gonderi]|uniref:Nuclear formin-like protein n=1 Tax=Plasmodium gonderi TaxID=77519 RepID=A0A1Y1JKX5_PLAGO|nr:nuclear formin-like protein [Plasmodium gonderi]GAW83176.1 nuclear formin-like protein [Plasmodium gonderi]